MNSIILAVVVALPMLFGALLPLLPFRTRRHMMWYLETVVVVNSVLVILTMLNRPISGFSLVQFTGNLELALRMDGMSMVFGGLVAVLWPFATLYSFEYMKHEEREKSFFAFYTLTYGVTLGIALADNIVTLYFFYELLTLVTVPLVIHTMSREAILAARNYLYYSLGGAAFAFIGMVFVITYSTSTQFALGGNLDLAKIGDRTNILLLVYVMAFLGFGVKAAICPFNAWLPQAGVAPTPVTALLHAVAVVKAGAYAILRLTYYCYGAEFLKGTWAQHLLLVIIIFTVVYGCSRAVKETHIKRRLAYSTISNLSYILFGAALMSPLGMIGAMCHILCHAFMKILSFFCAGAIMYKTERHYVHQLDGFGRRMPWVFGLFTISSFSLMGVPGFAGFISKWYLASAAASSGDPFAYVGIGALLISALLTAIYMLTIVVRGFFPDKSFDLQTIQDVEDPNWVMLLPLCFFAVVVMILGLCSQPVVRFLADVAYGLI